MFRDNQPGTGVRHKFVTNVGGKRDGGVRHGSNRAVASFSETTAATFKSYILVAISRLGAHHDVPTISSHRSHGVASCLGFCLGISFELPEE